MKVRESGMPTEELWENFFKSNEILNIMEFNHNIGNVAELDAVMGLSPYQHRK